MKKCLFFSTIFAFAALTVNAQKVYQLPNSDFESAFVQAYKSGNTVYTEPEGWHGYATLEGNTLTNMGRSGEKLNASSDVRPGSTGKQSAVISANAIFGVVANGVMTTGRINAKSTNATDAANNYNYSEPGKIDASNSNLNKSFSQKFNGHPDAMKAWVKFDAATGTQSSTYKYASCNAVITNNARYQDPEGTGSFAGARVARAYNNQIANYGNWQQLNMPFDYSFGASDDSQYILVTFTTNVQPGAGTEGDKLYIDDIEMVYNYELASLKVNGVEKFVAGQTAYDLSDVAYNSDAVVIGTNAHAAKVEKAYNPETALLTVTIKAEDFEVSGNSKTYTVQFKKSETPQGDVKTYTETLIVTINGEQADPQNATVTITDKGDGTCDFRLPNFILYASGFPMPVGTISVTGVTVQKGTDGVTLLSTEQNINIQNGDLPDVEEWIGPAVSPVPIVLSGKLNDERLYCHLTIDIGFPVVVTLGNESDVKPTAIQSVEENNNGVAAIYDLSGRLVKTPQKGSVYIFNLANGKKVKRVMK